MIRYRIIERVGTDDDHVWHEIDEGTCDEPTLADAEAAAARYCATHAGQEMQVWEIV